MSECGVVEGLVLVQLVAGWASAVGRAAHYIRGLANAAGFLCGIHGVEWGSGIHVRVPGVLLGVPSLGQVGA